MIDKVVMYTDGACRGNPGPGGWGVVLRFQGNHKTLQGYAPDTTTYAGDVLDQYRDTPSTGPLKRFEAWVDTLRDSVSVAAMYYNLEIRASRSYGSRAQSAVI